MKNLSIYEFLDKFPNEESAIIYFETIRWRNGVICPHCDSDRVSQCIKPMPYRCKECRKHFSIRTNSILTESKIPLHKWLMAMYIITTSRKGISSVQLAKELGITQKSAWFLGHRIREAWEQTNAFFTGTVEADETYIGGKEKNKHVSKRVKIGRGTVGKAVVAGIVDRKTKKVRAEVLESAGYKDLHKLISKHVSTGSNLYTDDWKSYKKIKNLNHQSVKHSLGEYVRDDVHTNTIESFWALLKRGHYGIYHKMTVKHLHRYINEFVNRQNFKDATTIQFINSTIRKLFDKRLTFEVLTNAT